MTKDEALREAIDTLKSTKHGNCDFAWIDETLKKCTEALAQPPLPVQQVGPVEDMLLRRAVLRSAKIVSDGRFVTKQAALEQPPQQPVQEPTPWRDMVVVSLVQEGVNKHKARELADHFAAQPEQRQPLTDEQIKVIHFDLCNTVGSDYKTVARAIEAAHNIKEKP